MTETKTARQEVLSSDVQPVHNFNVEGIPETLTTLNRWVCWAWEKKAGKWTKPLKQANHPLRNASSTDANTWTDFSTAVTSAEQNGLGIGFVFDGSDDIVGVDLDDCRDPETGKLAGWALDFIDILKTYTEVSPSGTGVKIFVRGVLPEGCRSGFKRPEGDGKVEVYSKGRFFTVTGQRVHGTPDDVRERQGPITALMTTLAKWVPEVVKPVKVKSETEQPLTPDRERQIKRASKYLEAIPGAIDGEGGSTATFIAVKKVLGFDLSDEDTFDVLQGWNFKCVPPWSDAELWKKIKDAKKSGVTPMADREQLPQGDIPKFDPLDDSEQTTVEAIPGTVQKVEDSSTIQAEAIPKAEQRSSIIIRPAGELIRDFPKLRPPVIEGLIRQGETLNIVAAPKMGKSWLSMAIGLDVATGRKVFDRYWTTPGKVLICDNELHAETSAHRLPQVADAKGIRLEQYADRLFVMNLRGQLLDINRMALEIGRIADDGFSLIILDAWYRFMPVGTDENSNGDVTAQYNTLDALASKLNCAFACIHHSSKGNQSGKSVTDTGSGAGSQSRAADCHLVMRQHREDKGVVVEAAVRSFAPVDPFCLRWVFPVFELADDLDTSDLRQDRPTRQNKQANDSGVSKEEQRKVTEDERIERVLEAYRTYPNGESATAIKETAGMSGTVFRPINAELIRRGIVTPCTLVKNERKVSGFILNSSIDPDNPDSIAKTESCPGCPADVVDPDRTSSPPLGGAVLSGCSTEAGLKRKRKSEVRVLSGLEVDQIGNSFGGQSA